MEQSYGTELCAVKNFKKSAALLAGSLFVQLSLSQFTLKRLNYIIKNIYANKYQHREGQGAYSCSKWDEAKQS